MTTCAECDDKILTRIGNFEIVACDKPASPHYQHLLTLFHVCDDQAGDPEPDPEAIESTSSE